MLNIHTKKKKERDRQRRREGRFFFFRKKKRRRETIKYGLSIFVKFLCAKSVLRLMSGTDYHC
jgi:hypothetical protein